MDFQATFNILSLQLILFTAFSGAVVATSIILVKAFPVLVNSSRYWLVAYCLSFLTLFPIAFVSFDNNYAYLVKDLFTLNQPHEVINAATENYIPHDRYAPSLAVLIFLSLVVLSTARAFIIFALRISKVKRVINQSIPSSQFTGISLAQLKTIERENICMRVMDNNTPAFAYGFFKKYILLPKTTEQLALSEQQMLVEHEIQHHLTNDTKKVIGIRLLTVFFWFNPFIHYLEKQFIRAMEVACDRRTLLSLDVEAKHYAKALLNSLKIFSSSTNSKLPTYFSNPNSLKDELEFRIKNTFEKPVHNSFTINTKIGGFSVFIMLLAVYAKSSLFPQSLNNTTDGRFPIPNGFISFDYSESADKPHYGIDIRAPHGSPVYASFTGKVIVADTSSLDERFGLTVLIEHKDNSTSLYANLGDVYVYVGQIVKAGQLIGSLGISLGEVSKQKVLPHLHFEISKSGRHFNPHLFLKESRPLIGRD